MTAESGREDRSLAVFGSLLTTAGIPFILGGGVFFLGSAILTQSGTPGASTPVPWMVSHTLWVIATALVAIGSITVFVQMDQDTASITGIIATGAFSLGVLHALHWTRLVYVDIYAFQHGGHDRLLDPVFHPSGTAHMLVFGILIGTGVAMLARQLYHRATLHRIVNLAGMGIGTITVIVALTALVTISPVQHPFSIGTILLIAVNFAWLFLLGLSHARN